MCSRGFKRLFRINRGRSRYREAWEFQKRLVKLRSQSKIPDCILFTEHEPVITLGRGTSRRNLLVSPEFLVSRGIDLVEIERGGDITYHGPGQTVVYPIIDLNPRGRDTHQYLRDLENVVIATLKDLGLTAGVKPGLTGVWVNDHKLAAIGVAVSKWITYHGLALNVTTDLKAFELINPCGITAFPVGSMAAELGRVVDLDQVNDLLANNFASQFYYEMETVEDIEARLTETAGV